MQKGHWFQSDRHETLGNGYIGSGTFIRIMRDTRFNGIPLILETPEPEIWSQEISWLRSFEGSTGE